MSSLNFNVSRAAEWPTEIQHLACLLDSPIPSRLANGPYPPVSSRASPLLEELESILECSPEHLTDSSSEVLDILDLLLSTVGALKVLAGGSKDDSRQSTIPFWSLLIRSLSFMCYDKSYIMQDATFVRPRLSHSSNRTVDGHASLLISHIVEDIQRPRPIVDDEASGHVSIMKAERSNEPSQEEYDSETSYDDESSSDSDTSYERTEASTDPTSAQSSYVPLDAHILAYWRHPNSVVLPYLCVTDEDDIFSLMSGVVYQRSTWGIAGPVIGIILSKTGLVGRVVFGWLDNVCVDPDLPAIHFAHADGTCIDPSLGVYDLTDAVSVLKFAQFIIGLRAHVEGIVAQCGAPTFKRLPWRSDTIDDDDSGSEEEQWEQRIVCWRNTVERCDADHTAPSDPSSTHCCSYNMVDSKKPITRASSKATSGRPRRSMSADSKREPPPAEPTPFLPDIDVTYPREPSLGATGLKTSSDKASAQPEERGRQQTTSDGDSSNNGKTGKRSKSADALSCSALGAKSLAGISPSAKLSFSSYAHDRKIISLTNVHLNTDSNLGLTVSKDVDASEINEMLGFYDKMTQYMKPPIAEHGLPVVDKRVQSVREHFLLQARKCPDGENTLELPQKFWEIISGCFSSILWASVGGYSKEKGGKSHNEAEARHEWDILLNLGFVDSHELASGRVVFERALSLSRNVASDLAKSSAPFNGKEFKDLAKELEHIMAYAFQMVLPRSSSDPTLFLQTNEVLIAAFNHRRAVSALFANPAAAGSAILKRAGDEPELGIVDAILTMPLDHVRKIPEPLVRVAETRETVNAARALNPDNIVEPSDDHVSEEPSSNAKRHAKKSSSRPASTRTRSMSTRMVAIEEETEAAPQTQLSDEAKKADAKVNAPVIKAEGLMHPFAVTCSVTKSAPKMVFPPGVVMDVKELLTKLLLAVLVAEYKKPTQTYAKAVVQAKMYAEASVRYLASLGVTKQAVFALATDGVEGAVLMAWCSSDSETVYIVERNVQTFNISSPIEVYHFVTVLLRLREYGDTALKDAVLKALEADEFRQKSWSKTAQFNRME